MQLPVTESQPTPLYKFRKPNDLSTVDKESKKFANISLDSLFPLRSKGSWDDSIPKEFLEATVTGLKKIEGPTIAW